MQKSKPTKVKKIESSQLHTEIEYRFLFENMLNGFAYCKMLFDTDGKPVDFVYLQINEAFEKLTGLKRSNVVGKKVTQAIPGVEQAHPELLEIYGKVAKTGKPEKFELYFKPLNIWLFISVYSPKKNYFVAVFDNITERKNNEEIIKNSAERFMTLAASLPEIVFETDITGRLTYVNQRGLELTGYSQGELNKGPINFDFFAPKDVERAKINFANAMMTSTGTNNEYSLIRKDGTEFRAIIKGIPIKSGEKTVGMRGIIIDITEQINAKQKLQEYSEELERKVAERSNELMDAQNRLLKAERFSAIGELAGMVGHDLRNPLCSIKNANYYIRRKSEPVLGVKEKEMLDIIDNSVSYANAIVNELVDYSREISLELDECTPKSLIGYQLLMIPFPAHIKVHDRTTYEPKMWADVHKLERVFTNIMTNAIDAMPDQGNFEISSCQVGNNIEFKFKDSGCGMSEKTLSKIFTPLFTTKAKGMGFGLAICKRIIDAHEGNIKVDSTQGKGTTFTVTLPVEQEIKTKNLSKT
jgi:PAS domain S-box-containing protein